MEKKLTIKPFDGHVGADGRSGHLWKIDGTKIVLLGKFAAEAILRDAGAEFGGSVYADSAATLRVEGDWIAGYYPTATPESLIVVANGPDAERWARTLAGDSRQLAQDAQARIREKNRT